MQGYRTILASFLPIGFGVLQMTDWNAFLANPKAGLIGIGSGLLMAFMRTLTTTPLGQK